MSPTILRLLRAYERQARLWSSNEHRYWRERDLPQSARYYGARCCWPDALSMARDTLIWLERS